MRGGWERKKERERKREGERERKRGGEKKSDIYRERDKGGITI